MKQPTLLSFYFLLSFSLHSQNVGVNNPSPQEKLDVNGNINLTGTIKANGVDGNPNQVLMKNSSGLLAWGDMCEYTRYDVFNFTSSGAVQTFIVPAGITKIKAAVWGGGGRSANISGALTAGCGGGGGGYIEGYFTVTPGASVSVTVGSGGTASITFSESSRVDVGVQSLIALGGGNASYNAGQNRIDPGFGGGFVVFSTTNYIGLSGENGQASIVRYDQVAATEFAQAIYNGRGGDAANSSNTGGTGGYDLINVNTAAVLSKTLGTNGRVPGGGGAANAGTSSGGNGRVIIYY